MGIMGILLLVGGALAGLLGHAGLDSPEIDAEAARRATVADEFALGDWIEGGQPVEITDFAEAEDIITFVYDRDGDAPDLSVEVTETTGITTIRADGEPIAVLRETGPAFSLRSIAVGRYVA